MLLIEQRAAQYVRMSTDMQRYSIENQSESIALYAARRGLTITRSYEDAGRSGLRLDGRSALQNLLNDVCQGRADFKTILVYDVSRWGRFQDTDESAYYEFLCKEAGVCVEYCAEQFENDGSLTATVLKNIKRAMAGEFSRELSVKVFAGQSRSVAKGFFIGSTPGYGLRRCLVDDMGGLKAEMSSGVRKSLSTDRTILVPGPPEETSVVLEIYDMFIDEKLSLSRIARELNQRGIFNVCGRPWNSVSIKEILSNEKYIGTSVYNRSSRKLNGRWRRNPPSEWVKTVDAFKPVVPKERFLKAQLQLKENARAYLDRELLDYLTALWCKEKRLTAALIDASPFAPGVNTYNAHFGGLAAAYRKIGYLAQFNLGHSPNIRTSILSDIAERIRAGGGLVSREPGVSQLLVNDELVIGVVACCAHPGCGKNQWQINRDRWVKPDILVVARVHDDTSIIEDYLVLPMLLLTNSTWLTISRSRLRRMKAFRSRTLEPLFRLCERAQLAASR